MTDTSGSIYALTEPSTGEIRYIGQTVVPLAVRLAAHRNHGTQRVKTWIRDVEANGAQPGIIELESGVKTDALDEAEKSHIQRHASSNLLNVVHNPHVDRMGFSSLETRRSPGEPISLTDLGRSLGPVVKSEVTEMGHHLKVTDHGHPIAVVVSWEWYRHIQLFIQNTPEPTP